MSQQPPTTAMEARPPEGAATGAGSTHADEAVARDLQAAPEVADFFAALDKALRARRLYQPNNPVYQGFLSGLDEATVRLWKKLHSLPVAVDEQVFRWSNRSFSAGENRDSLPFLFYKDGIRFITFLPGFEQEIERFLGVLYRARVLDQKSDDDIVTLLWQAEFVNFQYTYVDALAEGLTVPESGVEPRTTRKLMPMAPAGGTEERPATPPYAVQQGAPPVPQSITRADFSETLYFLDREELASLQVEVEREMQRDVRTDVLNALFDRLEEPNPERQTEILSILRQLLPNFLGSGEIGYATRILTELNAALAGGSLAEQERSAAEGIYRELSEPAVLSQLLLGMENGSIDAQSKDLGVFLEHLGPAAMPLLLRSMETTAVAQLQERLRDAMKALADRHRTHLVGMLRAESPEVVRGAARMVAQLGLVEAVPAMLDLLAHAPVELRRIAVDALSQLQHPTAFEGLKVALQDADRDIRITAARGLAAARFAPARTVLEEIVRGKSIREADLTEQIAFFEAFGAVATPQSVDLLDKLLNGRRLFGKEPPEVRACAAMALGRMSVPAARASLQKASGDQHPMVRNAVAKALRQEVTA